MKREKPDLSFVNSALQQYGAHLTEQGVIATPKGDTNVKVRIQRGRLRFESVAMQGRLLASYAPTPESVCMFVERYWFWEKQKGETL